MKQVTLEVFGMSCQGCVNTVKLTLERTDGVKSAEVTLIPGEAKVTYDDNIIPETFIKNLEKNTQYKAVVKI